MNRKEMQAEELRLIDLIVTDGFRDGLKSMDEHPRCQELRELQDKIYKPNFCWRCSTEELGENATTCDNCIDEGFGYPSDAKIERMKEE